jgi:hypothetical protein
MKLGDFAADWGALPETGRPSGFQLLMAARKGWFVRMAAKGFVPATRDLDKRHALILAVFPDLVHRGGMPVAHLNRMPWDVAERNSFLNLMPMEVRLPDQDDWIAVWVNSTSTMYASRLVRKHLPKGTKVRRYE